MLTKRGKQASRKAAARKYGFLEVPCRLSSRFSGQAGRRKWASNSSAIRCQFNSQTRNRTRVRQCPYSAFHAAYSDGRKL
ncbi:MAG: hypothetical protein Q8K59_06325 [Nitrosomonas sp.]|nr:hypothetical protein [Nitrosomonas sp.]